MKTRLFRLSGLMLASLLLLFSACSDDKNAKLQVWLTDAPGDFQEVNIDIQGVEIHSSNDDDDKGWKSLNANKGVYNLLKLTNGLDTLLGEIEIPAGRISQIRLVLGNDNTVKVNNQLYDLTTPSGQQSGLKLQIHELLTEGITYKILLDFDVARSIVQTGSGTYKLKPVIRSIIEAQTGAVKGIIDPNEASSAIYAINGTDTVGTTYSDAITGAFLLRGLPAGEYKIAFIPGSKYQPKEQIGIQVQTGNVTDLGVIHIDE